MESSLGLCCSRTLSCSEQDSHLTRLNMLRIPKTKRGGDSVRTGGGGGGGEGGGGGGGEEKEEEVGEEKEEENYKREPKE
ncbi:hypothetical protein M8J77_008568 [Diaphorina citri]|nr:hypothetical protein M8J77_008568 [Diaphorina citri]